MEETTKNPDVEYIRKDVFEARMDRMEMLMEISFPSTGHVQRTRFR